MREESGEFHKMVPASFQQRANAKAMMMKSFGDLAGTYNTLYNKYRNLMIAAFNDFRVPGVDGMDLVGIPHDYFRFGAECFYYGGNLKDSIDSVSYVENLASSMAIAEYLILGNPSLNESFTSAAHLMLGHISQFKFNFLGTPPPGKAQTYLDVLTTDSHQEGAYVQLYHYARSYRAIAACTYELIQRLKARDRFSDTVITLTSEFHRIPRGDGSGSDHGYTGSVYTLFTGMTDKLQVYGDIVSPNENLGTCVPPAPTACQTSNKCKPNGATFTNWATGTWGLGAPVPEFGGQPAVLGNAVSSVCSLLDLPTPTPNNPPFFTKGATGKVVSAINRRPRNDPGA